MNNLPLDLPETIGGIKSRQTLFSFNSPPIRMWPSIQYINYAVLIQTNLKNKKIFVNNYIIKTSKNVQPLCNVSSCSHGWQLPGCVLLCHVCLCQHSHVSWWCHRDHSWWWNWCHVLTWIFPWGSGQMTCHCDSQSWTEILQNIHHFPQLKI